jgi:hypothetical protein
VFVHIQRLHNALPLPAPAERRGAHCQTKPNQIKKRREIISKKKFKNFISKKNKKNSKKIKKIQKKFKNSISKKKNSNSKSARFFVFFSRG